MTAPDLSTIVYIMHDVKQRWIYQTFFLNVFFISFLTSRHEQDIII